MALRFGALEFAGAGALVKAFLPALMATAWKRPAAPAGYATAAAEAEAHDMIWQRETPSAPPQVTTLSPEAEAALAPLDLLPDGPIDLEATLRARLTPDVAARNFVSWARALDLAGDYSRRSIYSLYCEFSEVDGRPTLSDTRFLEALAKTDGITRQQVRGSGKVRRAWQWTIEPAHKAQAPEAIVTHAPQSIPAPVPIPAEAAPVAVAPEPPETVIAPARAATSAIVLSRFVSDEDHPFSPAGLREWEKSARRLRLNAAASRKQRGAIRRAA